MRTTESNSEKPTLFRWRPCLVFFIGLILLLLICVSLIGIVLLATVGEKPSNLSNIYRLRNGIVIKAESDQSDDACFFQWLEPSKTSLPELKLINQVTLKPGISSFAKNLPGLSSYAIEFMDSAKSIIFSNHWFSTPVFLRATAGMRLLNPNDQQAIIAEIRTLLNTTVFEFNNTWASVSSEDEEAIYKWTTVNYQENFLVAANITTGILDMGHASTQIALIHSANDSNTITNVTIGDIDYPLYVRTWPGYGIDDFQSKVYTDCIIKQSDPTSLKVSIPCMNTGDSRTFTYDQKEYTLSGTGDIAACTVDVSYSMNNGDNVFPNLPFVGLSNSSFVGIGGFYDNVYFFMNRISGFDLTSLKSSVSKYCGLSWDKVPGLYPSIDPNDLANYCFAGTYIHTLLTEKYKLNQTSIDQFSIGNDYNWAFGAMIQELGHLDTDSPGEHVFLRSAGGVVLMIICCFILVVCLIVVFIGLYQFYTISKQGFPTGKSPANY
jgi:hypothetical protein